ncbi:MAG: type II secretion system F family protein [Hydrogenothermaceae bacterium]|nr:type II secretion system F family protein [Hydrogenothermaceae bacterium]
MKEFYYEGYLGEKKVKGSIKEKDRHSTILRLREQGIVPIQVYEKENRYNYSNLLTKKPSEEELSFAFLQMHTLLKSGVPLTRALQLVSSQIENNQLSYSLLRIKSGIESGKSISDSFKEERIFPEYISNMLKSAQTGENLEIIFRITSDFLSTVYQIKSRIVSALIYPAVVIVFSFLSVLIATTFVVPKIASVLSSFGKELPLITKVVLLLSKVFSYLVFLLPVLLLGFILKDRFISRVSYDRFILRLPVVGKIVLFFNISRFARILSISLSSATPLPTAINMAINSLSNQFLRERIDSLKGEILKGKSLTSVLSKADVFPELFINLLKTGEESSKLEEMLFTASEVYTRQIERTVDRWLRLIEPLAMTLIGIIIAVIVISVILPMTELSIGVRR